MPAAGIDLKLLEHFEHNGFVHFDAALVSVLVPGCHAMGARQRRQVLVDEIAQRRFLAA
jgi:hypothetical protein